jgi:hypothetical protein
MRGDPGDNVFSAYPGCGESKAPRIKWDSQKHLKIVIVVDMPGTISFCNVGSDHEQAEHKVLEDYERNRTLIDLTAQPDAIKAVVDEAIREQISHKDVGMVGAQFLRFCGKYELTQTQ